MNPTPPQAAGSLNRFLNAIEAAGNKLPHITMLFIWALVITLVISLALSYPKSRSKPSRYSSENDVLIEKSVKYTDFFLLSIVYV